jgi:hypothetical protein
MRLMGVLSRPLANLSAHELGIHSFKKPNILNLLRRTLITPAQRRRATIVAGRPLSYFVVAITMSMPSTHSRF